MKERAEKLGMKILQDVGVSGIVTFRNLVLDSEEALEIDRYLSSAVDMTREEYEKCVSRLSEICTVSREFAFKNKVVLSGREVMAGLLGGETTYTGEIKYGALGTDATAVTSADTLLGAEVARKYIATRSRVGSTLSLTFYYSKADTSGTYEEFGVFIDGTTAANSGRMYNRVLTGGWVKSSLEAMTVSVQFDINEA